MEKNFKSLDEQIEILKSKGLIIEDDTLTRNILLKENYFFLNGYRHLLMKSPKDKTFIEGSTLFTLD